MENIPANIDGHHWATAVPSSETILDRAWERMESYFREKESSDADKMTVRLKEELGKSLGQVELILMHSLIGIKEQHNKGHRVDALFAYLKKLCLKIESEKKEQRENPDHMVLLQWMQEHIFRMIHELWTQYSHFTLVPVHLPVEFIRFFRGEMKSKVDLILDSIEKAKMESNFVEAMKRYFDDPVPHYRGPNRCILHSLNYFLGLTDSLYDICLKEMPERMEQAFHFELINQNFNRIDFVMAAANYLTFEVEEDDDLEMAIERLENKRAEIAKIPMMSGAAYMLSEMNLKDALLDILVQQISLLERRLSKREQLAEENSTPYFMLHFNMQLSMLFINCLLGMNLVRKKRKEGVPAFVVNSFCKADGTRYSLKTAQKKNSTIDPKLASGLIDLLEKMIRYIKDNYL